MYERMLNKQEEPTIAQTVTFPYGKQYGWGIAHRKNKKLICHVFAEENAFTVMIRLSGKQFDDIQTLLTTKCAWAGLGDKKVCQDGGNRNGNI